MKILLCCTAGMSTNLVVHSMKNQAPKNVEIDAVGLGGLEDALVDCDVVLFGPQLKYKYKKMKALCDEMKKPSGVIDTVAYGRADGKRILEQAMELIRV